MASPPVTGKQKMAGDSNSRKPGRLPAIHRKPRLARNPYSIANQMAKRSRFS